MALCLYTQTQGKALRLKIHLQKQRKTGGKKPHHSRVVINESITANSQMRSGLGDCKTEKVLVHLAGAKESCRVSGGAAMGTSP